MNLKIDVIQYLKVDKMLTDTQWNPKRIFFLLYQA